MKPFPYIDRQLREWRAGAREFKRRAIRMTAAEVLKHDPGNHQNGDVYAWRGLYGELRVELVIVTKETRRRLARLLREARRRAAAGDEEWFWWISEYRILLATDIRDDFDVVYGPPLQEAAVRARIQREGSMAGAQKSRAKGDATRAAMATESPGNRVQISQRHARRLKAQLKLKS